MAELIGPVNEEKKSSRGILDTIVANAVDTRKDRGTENMDFSNMRAGPMAAPLKKEDSFEVKALKNTLAAVSLLDEEDQDVFFSVGKGVLTGNIINPNENLAKIKASELAAKKIGYDGAIPVDLDVKTLFKIVADTKDKLPNDIRLKIEGNTDIVGNKELENVNLTAGKLGINFDGETAVGNYTYSKGNLTIPFIADRFNKKGKLNITPTITKTDDNIKTGTTAQYLFNEEMVVIQGPDGPRYIPKESITVKFNTDKMIDNNSGSVSYVLRQDDGSQKGTALLSTDADKFETGASYLTDGGIKFSGDYKKNYLTKDDETNLGLTFPLTSFADIEASKKFSDKGDDSNLRLNVGKEYDFNNGGTLRTGGYIDQDGNWNTGINYKLAYGKGDDRRYKKHRSPINYDQSLIEGHVYQDDKLVPYSEQKQLEDKLAYENWINSQIYGPTYSFNEPSEALKFAKEKKILPEIKFAGGGIAGMLGKPTYAKGGRVRMASGGIAQILKL